MLRQFEDPPETASQASGGLLAVASNCKTSSVYPPRKPANNSCNRPLIASAGNRSAANCFMTARGTPSGFSGGGSGRGWRRLLNDAAVFCCELGLPAQAISPLARCIRRRGGLTLPLLTQTLALHNPVIFWTADLIFWTADLRVPAPKYDHLGHDQGPSLIVASPGPSFGPIRRVGALETT